MKKIGILIFSVFLLTGCVKQVDLTEEQTNQVVNYAAHATLQYDRKFNEKLIDNESDASVEKNETPTTETATSETATSETPTLENQPAEDAMPQTSETGEQQPSQQDVTMYDIATLLKLDGFKVTYEGFEYSGEYTDSTVENGYTVKSLDGNQFVVLKFNVENTTDEAKMCDTLSLSPKFRVFLNEESGGESFASVMNNDLSILNNEVGAHQSIEAVLLAEVDQKYVDNVTSISLDIITNGEKNTVPLQ
jgi:hypothetical protein